MVFHFEEQPSWWDEAVDGPFEPFYAIACQSTGIVFPDARVGLAWLLSNYWPDEWGPVPPV